MRRRKKLKWTVQDNGCQRWTEDPVTGCRFVITHVSDHCGQAEFELEHSYPRGRVAVSYHPSMIEAQQEVEARRG